MQHSEKAHNRWLIIGFFLVALLLAVFPLPFEYRWYRPNFIALLLIYWVLAMPQQFGPVWWFSWGLAQDLVSGSMLGQHALGMMVMGYMCALSYQRIRNYTLWQQACWVFVLVGIAAVVFQWANSLLGIRASGLQFLWPAATSALIWPLFVFVLDQVKTRYRVN